MREKCNKNSRLSKSFAKPLILTVRIIGGICGSVSNLLREFVVRANGISRLECHCQNRGCSCGSASRSIDWRGVGRSRWFGEGEATLTSDTATQLMLFLCQLLTLASKACCDRLNPEVRANITARCVFCSPDTEAQAVFWGRCRTNLAQIGAVFSHW